MCNCRWSEAILSIVILVFALWPTQIFSANTSMWIVVVAAAVLLIHAFMRHHSHIGMRSGMAEMKAPRRRRRKKR